ARRPARGPVSKRTAVPALSTSPSCAAGTPRALTKAGRKGDATPKAAYMAAYSRRKRGSVVDRTVSPKGVVLTEFSLAAHVCLVCYAPACLAHETARVSASPTPHAVSGHAGPGAGTPPAYASGRGRRRR